MKKYITGIALLFCMGGVRGQVISITQVIQEQNQWCWAGVSQCVLFHYGQAPGQCDIAEFARSQYPSVFGTVNCCVNVSFGCNNPNYNWGRAGSIQDILVHFDNINNTGVGGALSTSQIATEMAANRLFIEHWSWSSGGGHFVVGHGISGTGSGATIYYMNPWFGEGFHFCTYSSMVSGYDNGDYTWDGTNKITSFPPVSAVPQIAPATEESVYPNPSTGNVWVKGKVGDRVDLIDALGRSLYHTCLTGVEDQMDLAGMSKGIYLVRITSGDDCKISRLVLQ